MDESCNSYNKLLGEDIQKKSNEETLEKNYKKINDITNSTYDMKDQDYSLDDNKSYQLKRHMADKFFVISNTTDNNDHHTGNKNNKNNNTNIRSNNTNNNRNNKNKILFVNDRTNINNSKVNMTKEEEEGLNNYDYDHEYQNNDDLCSGVNNQNKNNYDYNDTCYNNKNNNNNRHKDYSRKNATYQDIVINKSELKNLFEKTIMKKDEYNNLKRKKISLSFMLFYIIIYFFCCCTLLIANCQSPEIIDAKYNVPFHMLDFWGSFGFTLIEASILVIADMVEIGSVRYFIVAINIGTTLIAAVLFSFNPAFWEITCHWIEFSAQIFITLSDVLFIFHQFKKAENILYKYRYYELALVLVFAVAAILKLLVFGSLIKLGIDAEQAAHFFEYCGEMVNAIFAFVFTLVMYKECENNIQAIFSYDENNSNIIKDTNTNKGISNIERHEAKV